MSGILAAVIGLVVFALGYRYYSKLVARRSSGLIQTM